MVIVFFFTLILLILSLISLKVGILIKINEKSEIIKIFYITILGNIKIYSKPINFTNKKVEKNIKQLEKINEIGLIKEIIKKIEIKEFKLILKLKNENIMLNTYITAIISAIIESLRIIKKIENMYYKIETYEKNKILLEIKAELQIIEMRKDIIRCIKLLNKEKIYINK